MKRAAVPALVLVAVVAGGYRMLFPSEARRVRARLDGLVELINAPPGEGVDGLARAVRIGNAFAPDVVVDFGDGPPLHGRETVMAVASRLQERARTVKVNIEDVDIVVGSDRSSADVDLTVTVTTSDSTDAREFQLQMLKPEGAWLISRATVVRVLQK
jgi:sugar/nucleoside kinase (ribokinase family)